MSDEHDESASNNPIGTSFDNSVIGGVGIGEHSTITGRNDLNIGNVEKLNLVVIAAANVEQRPKERQPEKPQSSPTDPVAYDQPTQVTSEPKEHSHRELVLIMVAVLGILGATLYALGSKRYEARGQVWDLRTPNPTPLAGAEVLFVGPQCRGVTTTTESGHFELGCELLPLMKLNDPRVRLRPPLQLGYCPEPVSLLPDNQFTIIEVSNNCRLKTVPASQAIPSTAVSTSLRPTECPAGTKERFTVVDHVYDGTSASFGDPGCSIDGMGKMVASAKLDSPTVLTLYIRKLDGSMFAAAHNMTLYVGDGPTCPNPANVVKLQQVAQIGVVEQTMNLTLSPYNGTWAVTEVKNFWVGLSVQGFNAAYATGAIQVQRQCAP